MMRLTFLGTTSMIPTSKRNPPSMLLEIQDKKVLIDCGEGTQRQLMISKINPVKIDKIFITHWHGDHVLGLPGLLQTINAQNKKKELEIYGPKGTKKFLDIITKIFIMQRGNINLKVHEITKNKQKIKFENFSVLCQKLDHVVSCLGYSFIEADKRKINTEYLKKFGLKAHPVIGELQKGKDIVYNNKKISYKKATYIKKGKKVTFILDTKFTKNAISLSEDSDLLVCESTFLSDLEKKASEFKHLTAVQAAKIAKASNSKKLILTHFSQRYKDINKIEEEAKRVFKNVSCAQDFTKVDI